MLFHHDPDHDNAFMDRVAAEAAGAWPAIGGAGRACSDAVLFGCNRLRTGGHSYPLGIGTEGKVHGCYEPGMLSGVFVLGTGNHSAGWRYKAPHGARTQLPVIQQIARIAERGKFDLLFISDSMVMDPGDHPISVPLQRQR